MYKKIRIILVALASVAMLSVVIGIGAATALKSSSWNNVASGGIVGEGATSSNSIEVPANCIVIHITDELRCRDPLTQSISFSLLRS
jgi:hypothetical protein